MNKGEVIKKKSLSISAETSFIFSSLLLLKSTFATLNLTFI